VKQRVADYIADFLVANDITDVFTVTGGGAMHLNDAFGHHPKIRCTYNHHEQACALAAEAYARVDNKMAAVCVTSGPGSTNAITGVASGWLESVPMLVISGQVRYDATVHSTGLNLRSFGIQELEIVKIVSNITKYAEMLIDPRQIRYSLEKAIFLIKTGRPGPAWLDIPLDVQSTIIETDSLIGFDSQKESLFLPKPISSDIINVIIEKLETSKRPVITAGRSIRFSGGLDLFCKLIGKLKIPVVTTESSVDLISEDDPFYIGRMGICGNRAGHFAVQNSDLVLSLGCRLSIQQIGHNYKTWAREAYTIVVDIDSEELKKPTIHVDLPICADVKEIMEKMMLKLEKGSVSAKNEWIEWCQERKEKYPVVQRKHYDYNELANIYVFFNEISSFLPENAYIVSGNGSSRFIGSQAYLVKKGQRHILNTSLSTMGYDLPAAIGVCIAHGRREIACITGDGSIQMNLQELQTIKTNNLPIKIFILNNQGYHAIRLTQKSFFKTSLVGVGPESEDLDFPDMSKIAYAYGFPYKKCSSNDELNNFFQEVFEIDGPVIAEVFVTTTQIYEPKVASKKLEDGSMVSAPLEDLAPFLSREELLENMIIKSWDEK